MRRSNMCQQKTKLDVYIDAIWRLMWKKHKNKYSKEKKTINRKI